MNRRTLVIADDLTGAAEIAGIAARYGLSTRLLRTPASSVEEMSDVLVVDTDSRSLPPADAAAKVKRFFARLSEQPFDLIYKKTDSVLRGNVRAEIEALMSVFSRSAALLLPQNPSRGRTIEGGVYRIGGAPLDQTSFAHDPDHPTQTSIAADLLGAGSEDVRLLDASTVEQVGRHASNFIPNAIHAGGADFFEALLSSWHGFSTRIENHGLKTHTTGRTIFICGSTSDACRSFITDAPNNGIAIMRMGGRIDALVDYLRVAVFVDETIDPRRATTVRETLAEVTHRILSSQPVDLLCMEGGATAASVCERMGWSTLDVVGEFMPGVVCLQPEGAGPQIVVKPGSYAWPASLVRA